MRKEVLGGLGGFGGMFDLSKFALEEPVLVSEQMAWERN